MNKFKINLFYSSFCSYELEAQNEEEALIKARKLSIDKTQILDNLEPWYEADELYMVKK